MTAPKPSVFERVRFEGNEAALRLVGLAAVWPEADKVKHILRSMDPDAVELLDSPLRETLRAMRDIVHAGGAPDYDALVAHMGQDRFLDLAVAVLLSDGMLVLSTLPDADLAALNALAIAGRRHRGAWMVAESLRAGDEVLARSGFELLAATF